jgi:signal transduction histidine kinase
VRRRLRFAVLAPLLTAGILLVLWLLEPGNTVVLIPAVALAELAARMERRRLVWIALGVTPCVVVSIVPFADDAAELFNLVLRNLAFCFLALAAGDAVRSRREAVERAAAASEEQALRRLGDERLRIARDVHDVVAHAMVAINVQAGVAAHVMDRRPEAARDALHDIKRVSGDALRDLRATLGVLRSGAGEERAPVQPAQGLDGLGELAARLRAAGIDVGVDVRRAGGRPLPSALEGAGFRIVQEALTNVLRHSGARAAHVAIAVDGGALAIEVTDDGPCPDGAAEPAAAEAPAAAPGTGNGLRGMRERAAAVGGSLEAGPRAGGGWQVSARLPLGVPA